MPRRSKRLADGSVPTALSNDVTNTGSAFEGKCGKSVEAIPPDWESLDNEAYEDNCIQYYENPAFRDEIGPNIELFGDNGEPESLFGLQIDVNLGLLGTVRGIVKKCDDLEVEWRCGPDHQRSTSFVTKHDDSDTINQWYFQGKNVPSWFGGEERSSAKAAFDFVRSLADAPDHVKLVDWKHPYDVEHMVKGYDEVRWYATMNRLNDPRMAHHYGRKEDAVPTPIVLLVIAMCGSTRLPTIVAKEKEPLYEKADHMCRLVSGGGGGVGYGQLMGLEKIIRQIKSDSPAAKARSDANVWRAGYDQAQALMLVLSDEFEESISDYNMVDDLERLANLVADMLGVFITFMTVSLAPKSAKLVLASEFEFNAKHLAASSFVWVAEEDDDMKETLDKFKLCMNRSATVVALLSLGADFQ
mmetsp:Transcript_3563/g.9114  ORF Transcript_3563/g.9114 Transcript_3563/m.9114 type:complete len:414 (+) Transcript_3563:137-1378(+)|eukprot:CAMPEP_0181080902 /NCGR_PEP_ID=MMETSP1071-20121207/2818_1 /TAXON_ID=35127 /ORGANISM="Thalassiosira sp., Strain NH16" /LENGTH=413 /DNA_ID=CAMNT_0023162417 /DNA_START=113 /DNA_END=1354 /DNA_ORIENTATION=+